MKLFSSKTKEQKLLEKYDSLWPFKLAKDEVPALGEGAGILCNWVRDGEDPPAPMIEMLRYGRLLQLLPDHIVENLEKGRLAHDGKYPMLQNGLGFVETLSSIIVDGTAIASSSSEARLSPALMISKNYMQPGGIPGRTLKFQMRGRGSTLITTAGTMTLRQRIAATDVITGTIVQATGAITADTAAQTASQWEWEGHIVTRVVGSAGQVFGQGDADLAWAATTIANQQNKFSGSAGALVPAAATWDMTADQYLEMTGQWSLATAYSIQCHMYILESMN
jgi:hypothetical protein